MKATNRINIFIECVAFMLIVLFVYAAASKLRDLQQFRIQLGQSPLVTSFASSLSIAVPAIEFIVAGFLVVPKFRLTGLFAGYGLMMLFTFYISAILQLDRNIPCSCGGILEAIGWREHLIFNVVFSVMAFASVLLYPMRTENPANAMN